MELQEARVHEHFREQAGFCELYGSPFTARLIECLDADVSAGGPVAALVAQWPGPPRADMLALRLCGALHAAVLMGRAPQLAAEYPAARADWNMTTLWPMARAFFEREQAWVRQFIASPPQTNEVRRSIALLPAFLAFADEFPGPIDTFEIGASAGLNLNWDQFHYRTADWRWGVDGGVMIDTAWSGPAPQLTAAPRLRLRAACDQNPLDISDPTQRLQLRSYVWADQADRLVRFDAAVELALQRGTRVERADAAEWLQARLASRPTDVGTIVYHSVFLQYPLPATRAAIIQTIQAAGERATQAAPLAWLRLEPEVVLGGPSDSVRFIVDMITWPGARRRLFAITDGHVRSVEALPLAP